MKNHSLSALILLILMLLTGFSELNAEPGKVRMVIWTVPWGSESEIFNVPEWAYPGIVFAYDCYRGLKVPGIEKWLKRSLEALKYYIENNRTVFILFLCEKYYPKWVWRGYLDKVYTDKQVIQLIKDIVKEGERLYIGFSEQTGCLSSDSCVIQLIQAYSTIKKYLPLAKLFYYGGTEDDFIKILYLYSKIGLDLVGYDIWEYSALGGKLRPNVIIIARLLGLATSLGKDNIFIGEIGFRRDDSGAYINSWDWNKRYGKIEENADALYYDQVLDYIVKGIKPKFLGIWSCNDEYYAVCEEEDVQHVLKKHALNIKKVKY